MNLVVIRNTSLAISATFLLTSLVLLFVSLEIPAPWVLAPLALAIALMGSGCLILARLDPYEWFPLAFSWKCLREYAHEQTREKQLGAAAVWLGGWTYASCLLFSGTEQLTLFLAISGMLAFAAAALLDACIFWQNRRREFYYP